jgi:predicted ArsR family transcriptional regulator
MRGFTREEIAGIQYNLRISEDQARRHLQKREAMQIVTQAQTTDELRTVLLWLIDNIGVDDGRRPQR